MTANANSFADDMKILGRMDALKMLPPTPFDLQVSKLRPAFARLITEAVMTRGHHASLSAMIIDGEMWVIPWQINNLCDTGHGIWDEDDEAFIPPDLYLDRDGVTQELKALEKAWNATSPHIAAESPAQYTRGASTDETGGAPGS